MVDDICPGPFKFLAGIEIKQFESIGNENINIRFRFTKQKASKICERLEPITAKVIAKYNDRKKFYHGKPAITMNSYMKGKVYYIGTSLTPESLAVFFLSVLRKEKMKFSFWGKDLEIIKRKGKNSNYTIALNHSFKNKFYKFHLLKPYSYKIIKEPK